MTHAIILAATPESLAKGGKVVMLDGVVKEMTADEIALTLKQQKAFGTPRISLARKADALRAKQRSVEPSNSQFRDGVWHVKVADFGSTPFAMYCVGNSLVGETYASFSVSELRGEVNGNKIWWDYGEDSRVKYEGTIDSDGSMAGVQHKKNPAVNESGARLWTAKYVR